MAQYTSAERDEGYRPAAEPPNLRGESKARTPTYRHAERQAARYGDSTTYFMNHTRRSGKRAKKSRGGRR